MEQSGRHGTENSAGDATSGSKGGSQKVMEKKKAVQTSSGKKIDQSGSKTKGVGGKYKLQKDLRGIHRKKRAAGGKGGWEGKGARTGKMPLENSPTKTSWR